MRYPSFNMSSKMTHAGTTKKLVSPKWMLSKGTGHHEIPWNDACRRGADRGCCADRKAFRGGATQPKKMSMKSD
jgi:hypothetical protein